MLGAVVDVAPPRAAVADVGAEGLDMGTMKKTSLAAFLCAGFFTITPVRAQEIFTTPEAAMQALIDAAKNGEKGFLARFFGKGSEPVFQSGDAAVDQERLRKFNEAAAAKNTLLVRNDTTRVLQLGNQGWTFPVPLKKIAAGWQFDLAAGKLELLDREIGQNELSAIEACKTFAAAQAEYFSREPMGDDIAHYAQKIISSPGKRDGLYWPAANQKDRSPLEGFLADSALAAQQTGQPAPYRGYYYRILTAQGASAPGGAHSYLVNGRMLNGAALIATPAEWGKTGVMTFVCNQRGRIYERNFGADSAARARAIKAYDPGPGWTKIN